MGRCRYVRLSEVEDERLREVEQSSYFNGKVRLRTQILRLSNGGWTIAQIATHVGKSRRSVERTFDAWEEDGLEGLADLPQPGNRRKLKVEVLRLLQDKLAEDRCWNARQLVEAIIETFGLKVDEESVRRNLKQLGYTWKRDRYVVAGQPDPELLRRAEAALDTLKKGHRRVALS